MKNNLENLESKIEIKLSEFDIKDDNLPSLKIKKDLELALELEDKVGLDLKWKF